MRPRSAKRRLPYLLLTLSLAATCLPAQPLLHLADSFAGFPFSRTYRMAFTADGTHLYASSNAGLSVFRREAAGEPLQLVATLPMGEPGEDLQSAGDFVFSPDESHVYVLAPIDRLRVFSRDPQSGLLTAVQSVDSDDQLSLASYRGGYLAISPMGDSLIVGLVTPQAQRFLVFARSSATGMLSFVQELTAPPPASHLLLRDLLFSPDGAYLYSLGDPAVTIFSRDASDGRLTFVEAIDHLSGTEETLVIGSEGVFSSDGAFLYLLGANSCYNSCKREAVAVLQRDAASGGLELVELVSETIRPQLGTMTLSSDERHLYLADLDGGDQHRITTLARDAGSGLLEPAGELVGRPAWPGYQITKMQVAPSGGELYASGFENRPLPRLLRDPASGTLDYEPPVQDAAEGIGDAWDLAVSPDGGQLYAVGMGSVASFAWNDATATLEPRVALNAVDEGLGGLLGQTEMRLSSDGSELYLLTEWGHLITLAPDGSSGDLELAGDLLPEGVNYSITHLEISADGAHIYLFSGGGAIVLARQPGSEAWGEIQVLATALSLRTPVISPDDRFIYALAHRECPTETACSDLIVFERDPASGLLTQRNTISGAGTTPFEMARAMVVSPDGAHLYLSSIRQGLYNLAVFARNPDGSLEWLETIDDGETVDPSYYGNRELAIAPDGRHLYAVRRGRGDLVAFERDPATGALTRLQTITDDDLGTGGLERVVSATVSADSQLIFVAGKNKITTFSRRCLTAAGLCLEQERFRVELDWRSFDGTSGSGKVVPAGSDDSGLLWFFEADNWEMLIKVLDGCGLNDRFWVFAGATTTVEYTLRVTDTATGIAREYFNPLGNRAAAITDTDAFATCADATESAANASSTPPAATVEPTERAESPQGACVPSPTRMCLSEGRFGIEVEWGDYSGNTGSGRVVDAESPESGLFWFFDAGNWEMLVKVLDACEVNGKFWMLAAATTDVEYTLRVTDTTSGITREYFNSLGTAAPALVDIFATCSE